jgi:hypothetical protein
MPIPTTPMEAIVMRDSVVTIDGDEFAGHVRKSRIVPDINVQTYKTLIPDGVVVDQDIPVWTWELEGLQTNGTGGLAKALRDAAGTIVEIVLQPKSGAGHSKATFNALITQIPFGGEQGEFMVIDVSFAIQGQPVFGTSS